MVKRGKWVFFRRNQPEGSFNTARVLNCIRKFMEQRKNWMTVGILPLSLIHFLIFPDPQTLPSQTTLDLIVNKPLDKYILTEALNRRPLESRNGIEQRFRLTSIRELVTDRTPLLSFIFYTGAFTYQYNTNFESRIILEAEDNFEPLCRFIEEAIEGQ
ncbi:1014_t:CDS:2 [Ambispora gerdemannii]|uniref:1014_t:CDS:1 n=1 Tax=Ambispora gerdemannii TaxID=144530 RepID=A0A9N9APX6_9GLOM|nr:1014_t:CDS:2 [Ambispora gerdemannii]